MDQPLMLPEWASNPPTPGGGIDTTITVPTAPERAVGFQRAGQPLPVLPEREYFNWFFNLVFQWIAWLAQVINFPLWDLFPDQALPSTPRLPTFAPEIGPGLSYIGEDFNARGIVGGFLVGPIGNAAITLPINSDTYFDLGRDGVLHDTSVAAGAPAPAVGALRVRCYRVRTDGADRTAVEDFRRARFTGDRPIELNGQVHFGPGLVDSAANAALVRRNTAARIDVFTRYYTHVETMGSEDVGGVATRLYVRSTDGALVAVHGAAWNQAGGSWVPDGGMVALGGYFTMTDLAGGDGLSVCALRSRYVRNDTTGAEFDDALWYDALSSGVQPLAGPHEIDAVQVHKGSLMLGADMLHNAFEVARVARLRHVVASDTGALRTLVSEGIRGGTPPFLPLLTDNSAMSLEYILGRDDNGTAGAGRGWERLSNCIQREDGQFERLAAGDSWKFEVSSVGTRLLRRAASDASPWADTIDDVNGWRADRPVPPLASETVPVANAVYQRSILKASATIDIVAGVATILESHNVTGISFTGGQLDIALSRAIGVTSPIGFSWMAFLNGIPVVSRPTTAIARVGFYSSGGVLGNFADPLITTRFSVLIGGQQ